MVGVSLKKKPGDEGREAEALAWEKARLWAEYHESLGDYSHAEQWLQRALVLAWQQNDERRLARVQIKLGTIAWRQGEFDHAQEALQIALAHASAPTAAPSAATERADALYALGLVNRQQARFEEAQRCFSEDLALRAANPNPEREARALNAMGNMRAVLRDPVGALDFFQRALAIRRAIGDRSGIGSSLLAIGQCYSSMARLAEAESMLREALRIQRATRNRFQECLVGNELGIVQWLCGQYAAAEATLQASLDIAQALESTMLESYVLCNLGQVQRDATLAVAGDASPPNPAGTAQAIATLERGLAMALDQEDRQLAAIYQSDLALALHLAGEHARALLAVDEAARTYRSIAQEKELTTVLPTRARILLTLGERNSAVATAHAAIALLDAVADELPEFAHRDYYYSGTVLAACNETAAANRAFATARRLLLHRAEQITSDALRDSFLHNVPHNRALLVV